MNNSIMKDKLLNKILIVIISLVLLSANYSLAQKQIDIVEGIEITLKSKKLGEERVISIYLPDGYDLSSRNYPVLYLLDGRTHFHHAIGAVKFLSNSGVIPQIIVVSIHNIDRNKDFLPVSDSRIPTSGGAKEFLSFVSDELTKYINKNYRVSGFDILMGHSFGGLLATYSLLSKPKVFDGYIAISPFLQYADNYIVDEAKNKLKTKYNSQKFYYLTVGNEPEYFSALEEFSSIIKDKPIKSFDFQYVKMETENHITIPYVSVFNGLKFIFSDYQFPTEIIGLGLVVIDKHYEQISSKYGYEIKTPENVINAIGYTYLQQSDNENAIKVFNENVKRYPLSSNVYDSLGEAYEADKQYDLAKANYQKAYDLGSALNNINTPVYLKNLNRVMDK